MSWTVEEKQHTSHQNTRGGKRSYLFQKRGEMDAMGEAISILLLVWVGRVSKDVSR